MWYLLIALIAVGAVAAVIEIFSKNNNQNNTITQLDNCSTCGSEQSKCQHDCMLEAAVKDIVYFDDEELDMFKGKDSADYTEKEVAMFREVLYTMKQNEVREWIRSLTLRDINIPNDIKDEVMLMIE